MPGISIPTSLPGLEKMILTSFADINYQNAVQSLTLMYNPTTFSQDIKAVWVSVPNMGAANGQLGFRAVDSDNVTFEFMFDATGASPPGANVPGEVSTSSKMTAYRAQQKHNVIDIVRRDRHVDGVIKKFMELCHSVDEHTHQPNFLQINWGAFEFRGVLDKATVNYKLFNNSGLPIRATLSATFKKNISPTETATDPQTSSPDLTHYRTVEAGDSLPLLTYSIYEDPMLYLEVARTNNMKNFRRLRNGQRVAFPPIKDQKKK